jgi:hypothetical protein
VSKNLDAGQVVTAPSTRLVRLPSRSYWYEREAARPVDPVTLRFQQLGGKDDDLVSYRAASNRAQGSRGRAVG